MDNNQSQGFSQEVEAILRTCMARLERAEAEKEAAVRLSRRLAGTLSYTDLMDVLSEESDRLLGWDAFYLAHKVPGRELFRFASVVDTVDGRKQFLPFEDTLPNEFSPVVRQVLEGRPVLINRSANDPAPPMKSVGTSRPSASLMFVPVQCEGAVIGVLTAQSYTPGRYGEADLRILQDFADTVAPALERVHAEEALLQSQALLALERDLALAVSSTSDLKAALDQLLEISLRIEGIDCGGAYIVDAASGNLDLVCHRGLSAGFVESIRRINAESRRGKSVGQGKPLYIPRAQLEAMDEDCRREGLRALAGIPVVFGARAIALLNLASLTLDDIPSGARDALETIAAQMGTVVSRIRAEQALREARDLLETRVTERTAELLDANRRLQVEITEREHAQQALLDSEQKHRLLIETNAIGYVILDGQGRVLDANQEYLRFTGRPNLDDILGRPVTDWTAEQDVARNAEEIGKCVREGSVRGLEITYRTPSGELIPVEINAAVLLTQAGARILSLIQDISDRKRAEQALRESEAKYRTVIETTGTGYVVVDLAGHVLDANNEYVRLSGHDSQADILGRPVTDWTAPHDRERNAREVSLCGKEGIVRHLEVDYIDRTGRITPVEVNATRVRTGERDVIIAICRDITRRKRTEETLREREEQLRSLSENLAEGMVYQINTGPDGRRRDFTYLSPAVEHLHGLKLEDALRNPSLIYEQMIEEDLARVAELEAHAIATRTTFDADTRVRLPSGEIRWRRFISSPRALPDGSLVWDGIELDTTGRKQAEEALRESEAHMRNLISSLPLIVYSIEGGTNKLLLFHGAAQQIFGMDLESIRKDTSVVQRLVHPMHVERVAETWRKGLALGKPFELETPIIREVDGQTRWLYERVVPVVDDQGRPLGHHGFVLDITDRKRAEEALRRKESELRRFGIEANRQLEKERKRISRELHDELGQMLTALNLNLAWLDKHMERPNPAVMERLAESIDYVSRTITSVRDLSKSLRPAALSHQGLIEAVRAHVVEFEQYSGISCDLAVAPRDLEVAEPVTTTAFRIIQEALTNVARHSQAKSCFLSIESVGDVLQIRIRDNGVGLGSTDMANLSSLGVAGMKERAEMIGGEATVENAPGGGVCVAARLPLRSDVFDSAAL